MFYPEYDKLIWADTNEICFMCKRCVPKDINEQCIWHKSKGTVLVPGSVVSSCIGKNKSQGNEGSYKILRCPKFVPDTAEDFTEMTEDEYQAICDILPDSLFQRMRDFRERLYEKGNAYNELEGEYHKINDQLIALIDNYELDPKSLADIVKKYKKKIEEEQKHKKEVEESAKNATS